MSPSVTLIVVSSAIVVLSVSRSLPRRLETQVNEPVFSTHHANRHFWTKERRTDHDASRLSHCPGACPSAGGHHVQSCCSVGVCRILLAVDRGRSNYRTLGAGVRPG